MIEWLPGGEAFVVLKSFDLASQILPRYFKSGQYESFVRKLNRWGFRRDSRGRRTGAFYHENFIRDRPDLMVHMSNRRAVSNPRGLGPKHLRGVAAPGMNPPPGAATAAAAAAAADRQHANATMGLGLGVGLDTMSGMTDADFLALRHRQMARHHAAAAAQAAAGGHCDPTPSAPGFLEAYAAHEASRMGLRHGSAAAGAPGASPPGSSAVAGAPGLPPPLPPHAASRGHLGTSPHALHGDALLHHRHFFGTGADPLIQEASLIGRTNGNPQLAAAAADLAEAEAELVRLRSLRALRAGGALPPHHAHMVHLAPGAVPGSVPHLPGPGASATGMPPLPPQAGEAPASAGMAAPADAALAAAIAAAPGAPAPPPIAEAAAAGAAAAPSVGDPAQIAYLRHQHAVMRTQESRALLNRAALANSAPGASPPAAAAAAPPAPAAAADAAPAPAVPTAAAATGNETGSV